MQCAEIVGAGKPLRVTSRPRPTVPDEGLLLRTLCAGVCHSDVHFIEDEQPIGGGQVFRHRDILGNVTVTAFSDTKTTLNCCHQVI